MTQQMFWYDSAWHLADILCVLCGIITAWPRVLPTGTGEVNEKGLQFYKDLTNALVEAGITPSVTLYHWDLPSALQENGGWLNTETADAFANFADIMFEALGDKVKMWFTINEPVSIDFLGYKIGTYHHGI